MSRVVFAVALIAPTFGALRVERAAQQQVTRRAAVSSFAAVGLFGALPAFADDEEYVSPAKAKILAAKAAGNSKLNARGQEAPTAKAVEVKVPESESKGDKATSLFSEANALRAQINEINDGAGDRKLSKAQSAKLNQLKQKEGAAREKAQDLFNKEQQKKAIAALKAKAKAEGKDVDDDDKFAKITGVKLPKAPSVELPNVGLPSLPF